jgi:hypothetical protein
MTSPRDLFEDGYFEWEMPGWDGPTHDRPLGFVNPPANLRSPAVAWRRLCDHWRRPVELLEGITVFASAYRDRPRGRLDADWADVGFYLDPAWAAHLMLCSPGFQPSFVSKPRTNVALYPWPDFGEPLNEKRFVRAVRWLLSQARNGRRIEIGCLGGHGRTGTTIACMLVLQGMETHRAIERVRRRYCDEAIETRDQELLVLSLDPRRPKPQPARARGRTTSPAKRHRR